LDLHARGVGGKVTRQHPALQQGDADCRHEGRFCRMVKTAGLQERLAARYGRPNLAYKINKDPDERWEWSDAHEVALVQNIGAMHDCAPRVYAVEAAKPGFYAHVLDWVSAGHEPTLEALRRLLATIKTYDIGTRKIVSIENRHPKWDIVTGVTNWSREAFLDWGGYYLEEPEAYREMVVERLSVHISTVFKGTPSETTYQGLEALGIPGDRDLQHRLEVMRWGDIAWGGKDVLDIGCNLGAFCFEAANAGARRVVGVDVPFIASPMRHAANLLRYWNMDFYGLGLPAFADRIAAHSGLDNFDVVLALSVCRHIGGYAPWIATLVKPGGTLILETHGDQSPAEYEADLRRDFASVELAGYTTDVKTRGVFIYRKGD